MIDPLQQLAADPNLDANFRRILAGGSITFKMKAASADTQMILQAVATEMCATDTQAKALQMVYDLGKIDGSLEAKKEALATLKNIT